MKTLYSLLYTLLLLVALPYFLVAGLVRRKYLESASERFGRLRLKLDSPSIWVHAVSVGEFLAAKALINKLQMRYPAIPIVVSTTTITGQTLARQAFPGRSFYFPFDWRFTVRRTMRIIRPKLILILETEIWPNFLWEAERNSVPVVLVNGRLSDRSFSRYKLFRSLLPRFTYCLMQSDQDRSRMEALAIYKNGVEAAGNLKFDFTPSPLSPALRDLLCDWKKSDLLWIAGSTMEGEEPLLLHVLKELSASYSLKLLLAPRHPERFSAVYERASLDHVVLRRSEYGFGGAARPAGLPANSRVMILDSIGELAACYEFADIVTIGGTFRSGGGGHNPIEPAYFGKAILAGENFRNFRAVFDEFRARDAILITSKLKRSMASLLRDPERRQRLGRNAKQLLIENQGATERAMSHIEQYVRD